MNQQHRRRGACGQSGKSDEKIQNPGEFVAEEGARSIEVRGCGFDSIKSLLFDRKPKSNWQLTRQKAEE